MLRVDAIRTADELREWAVWQLAAGHGAPPHRFSLVETATRSGEPYFRLTRWERQRRFAGGTREEWVALDEEIGRRLHAAWPTSARTGGRAPQSPATILRLVAGTRSVAIAEREAEELRARWRAKDARLTQLENAADAAFPDRRDRYRWLHAPHQALDNMTPEEAARGSAEGLAAALALLAPLIEAREAAARATAPPPFQVVRGGLWGR